MNLGALKRWLAAIAIIAGGTRFGFLSFLHHQYMQSGVTAWHGVHAVCISKGHPFFVDSSLVYRLQSIQNEQNRLVDPQDVLDEGWKVKPEMRWPGSDVPGYSFLLAGLWKVLPAKYIFAQITVIVLDVLAALSIAIAAAALFGTAGGISIGILYAFFPIFAMFPCFAARDHFGLLGIVFSFLLLTLYIRSGLIFYLIMSSLALGIFSWFRPFGVILPFFYSIGIAVCFGFKKGVRDLILLFGFLAVVFFLPYSILNKALYNRLTSSMPWIPLAQGLGEIPNQYGFQNSDEYCVSEARTALGKPSADLMEVGDYWKGRVIAVAKDDPGFIFKVLLHRAKTATTMGYTPFLNMPRKGLGKWWNLIAIPLRWLLKSVFLWLALGAIFIWRKRGWRLALVTLVPGFGYFLSIFLFRWPDPRYYYPWLITPILVFGAVIGILAEKMRPLICLKK